VRRRAVSSFIALGAALLSGCVGTTVLEQRHVLNYSCASNALEITLSGLSSGSALKVARVSKSREGKDLLVNVRIGLVTFSDTGNFVEKIPIKPGLSRVLFGRERVVVWTREGGCAPMT